MTFRSDATSTVSRPGACWSGQPTTGSSSCGLSAGGAGRPDSCRYTRVVEGRLLDMLWPLGPLVAWLLRRQCRPDLRRLHFLLQAPTTSGPTSEGTVTEPLSDGAADDPPGNGPSGSGTAPT